MFYVCLIKFYYIVALLLFGSFRYLHFSFVFFPLPFNIIISITHSPLFLSIHYHQQHRDFCTYRKQVLDIQWRLLFHTQTRLLNPVTLNKGPTKLSISEMMASKYKGDHQSPTQPSISWPLGEIYTHTIHNIFEELKWCSNW